MYISGLEECRICGFQTAFVAPEGCDLDNMECANCHNMTSEIIGDDDGRDCL